MKKKYLCRSGDQANEENRQQRTNLTRMRIHIRQLKGNFLLLFAKIDVQSVRYRLQVTNLNASVSESDLVDLFCAIGAVRDSRLQSTGEAIVTFVKRAAAMAAITKYNGRELDGQKISGIFSYFYSIYKCSSQSVSNNGAAKKVTLSMEK